MRELQNGYLAVMGLIIVTVIACTSAIGEDTFAPVPTDYLDAPQSECIHTERYEFDTPGIDAHEIKTKKKCEEVISQHEKI